MAYEIPVGLGDPMQDVLIREVVLGRALRNQLARAAPAFLVERRVLSRESPEHGLVAWPETANRNHAVTLRPPHTERTFV